MKNYNFFRSGYRSRVFRLAVFVGVLLCAGSGGADTLIAHPAHRAARIQAVEEARAVFGEAESAGAEYKAPYEFAMAKEYLELAIREWKEGDRIGIREFSAKSIAFSNLAMEKSTGGAK